MKKSMFLASSIVCLLLSSESFAHDNQTKIRCHELGREIYKTAGECAMHFPESHPQFQHLLPLQQICYVDERTKVIFAGNQSDCSRYFGHYSHVQNSYKVVTVTHYVRQYPYCVTIEQENELQRHFSDTEIAAAAYVNKLSANAYGTPIAKVGDVYCQQNQWDIPKKVN